MCKFDPGKPDGTNRSLEIAISADGTPAIGQLYTIEERCGMAVKVNKEQTITIINPSGNQVCDFWAFAAGDLREYLSMEHLHTALGSIFPKVGDALVSNKRRLLMTITEDTSPGIHDTIIASCDHARYQQLGCSEYHDNCVDNLRQGLIAIKLTATAIPAPFNLWMNVPVAPDGKTSFEPPVSKAGDQMSFRAETETIVVMSACPQDLTAVNGPTGETDILQFVVNGG